MKRRKKQFASAKLRSSRKLCASPPIIHHPSSFINAKGFTLVELLVVIGIVAVLMALLFPVLGRARKQARAAACQVNLRQWGTTLAAFADDNDGRFLHGTYPQKDLTALWILTGMAFKGATGDDIKAPMRYHPISTKGMLCPEARRPGDAPGGGGSWGMGGVGWSYELKGGGTVRAWVFTLCDASGDIVHVSRVSYGFNGWVFGGANKDGLDDPMEVMRALLSPEPPSYTNIFLQRGTAGTPLLLDSINCTASPGHDSRPPDQEGFPRGSVMTNFCINRHNAQVNCLFLDWSVRKVGLKELWTLKWDKDFNTAGKWTRAGGIQPEDWPEWMRGFKDY